MRASGRLRTVLVRERDDDQGHDHNEGDRISIKPCGSLPPIGVLFDGLVRCVLPKLFTNPVWCLATIADIGCCCCIYALHGRAQYSLRITLPLPMMRSPSSR